MWFLLKYGGAVGKWVHWRCVRNALEERVVDALVLSFRRDYEFRAH